MGRAAVAGKALADEGLMHHSEHRRALVQQRDQRAPERKARDEGFRAVDRVQHPDIFGVFALIAEFLVLLLSTLSEVRKNGRMVSPEAVARRPMKAVKSMTVTAVP